MAVIYSEGFDTYGGIGSLSDPDCYRKGWSNRWYTRAGRINGTSMQISGYNSFRHQLPSDKTSANKTIGFAFRKEDNSAGHIDLMQLRNGDGEVLTIGFNTSQQLIVQIGGVLEATGTTVLSDTSWHFIEFNSVISATGSYELRLNGQLELQDLSVDTTNGAVEYWYIHTMNAGPTSNSEPKIDDLYITDDSGSYNTGFMGPLHIETIFPDADVTKQWTTSTGTDHYALVDNDSLDDATYVESSTTGQRELFDFPASDVSTKDVYAVCVKADMGITGVLPVDVNFVTKSSGTTDVASAIAVSSPTRYMISEVVEEDPDTSAAWTKAGFDAAQFGVEVT